MLKLMGKKIFTILRSKIVSFEHPQHKLKMMGKKIFTVFGSKIVFI